MTKEQLSNKINDLQKQIESLAINRKYNECSKLNKERNKLVIDYNKLNNCYYHEEVWIKDLYCAISYNLKSKNLTGNALTRAIAQELNKVDGVVLEEQEINQALNYSIEVITPYTIYHYRLFRGYAGACEFDKSNFTQGNNKTRARVVIPSEHIAELIYDSNYEELKNKFNRNILIKSNDKLDINKLVKEFNDYLDDLRQKQMLEQQRASKSIAEALGL